MARKTKEVTIGPEGGRDAGKHFLLTEMSASRAERWAARAVMAMMRTGIDLPTDIAGSGMAGLAAIGLRALAGMSYDEAEPLLDEMMECVSVIPDPARPQVRRTLIEDDIEEVMTRLQLRREVVELHVGFSLAAGPSTTETAASAPTALAS
jgi:hypothetical protein